MLLPRVALLYLFTLSYLTFSFAREIHSIHLAIGEEQSVTVGWISTAKSPKPSVEYGLSEPPFPFQSFSGFSEQLTPETQWSNFIVLSDLEPATLYYYRCGDVVEQMWSTVKNFTSPPSPGSSSSTVKVVVYGDMGVVSAAKRTVRRVEELVHTMKDVDFIFHVGDISYADLNIFSYYKTWDKWFELVEPIASLKPYMVLPGNHELASLNPSLYNETKNFVSYNSRFLMPGAWKHDRRNMYYSFNYGAVHFVSISTETSFPGAPSNRKKFGNQMEWLKNDLQEANLPENREKQPWIVVSGHRPIYSSSKDHWARGKPINSVNSNSVVLQRIFERVFVANQVDLYLAGHVHSYERSYPVLKGMRMGDYVRPEYPVHVAIGTAGNPEGLDNTAQDYWAHPQPDWSARRLGTNHGFGLLQVHNSSMLQWSFISSFSGEALDEMYIIK